MKTMLKGEGLNVLQYGLEPTEYTNFTSGNIRKCILTYSIDKNLAKTMSSKRLSSEYSFEPQLKKLFDDQSADYKNSIYERTIRKLFDGAKKNAYPKPTVDIIIPAPNNTLHSEVKRGLKQISLDNNGRLQNTDKLSNPKVYYPILPEKCSFCERLGCFTMLNQCLHCHEYFCCNCSFVKTHGSKEVNVCKSCY